MHRVRENENQYGTEQGAGQKQKRRFRLSVGDVGIFALFYVVAFIAFRFDIRRYGPSLQHPMSSGTSAWVALLLAIAIGACYKRGR
jgi:hypothetical protein